MNDLALLRDDLADLTSYGLLAVGLLVLGFIGLDLVTPGSLRRWIWTEGNRSAVILAVSQALGLTIALAAGISASHDLPLARGILYVLIYGVATIALMMFSFVLIDLLTPGKLGALLLEGADDGEDDADDPTHNPAVWLNAVVFLAIGLFVAAALYL